MNLYQIWPNILGFTYIGTNIRYSFWVNAYKNNVEKEKYLCAYVGVAVYIALIFRFLLRFGIFLEFSPPLISILEPNMLIAQGLFFWFLIST